MSGSVNRLGFKELEQGSIHSEQHVKYNPFLFVNKVIRYRIRDERLNFYGLGMAAHFVAVVITQPLNVIGTLMQLSVKQHKHIHDSPPVNMVYDPANFTKSKLKLDTKAMAKINKDITMTEKKKIQMQILSGVKHKPFTAPVYDGYLGVVKDLYSQGLKSFYKGLVSTSILQFYRGSFRYGMINCYLYPHFGQTSLLSRALVAYTALTAFDIAFNSIHMMESRFILQSSMPEYSTYKGIRQFMTNNILVSNKLAIGWKTHLVRNFFIVGGSFAQFGWASFLASYLACYPITTAYKRILCQAEDAGMIPGRYASVSHAFRLILQEQGLRGLYKGVLANTARESIMYGSFYMFYFGAISSYNDYWMRNILMVNN